MVEIKSTDRLLDSIVETRKMGISVDPPNINYSDKLFTVVDGRIVYGFLGIKGIGDAPADEIVRGRQNGHYKSFLDFLERVDIKAVGKKVIDLLIQTGAFDDFKISRETLAGNMEKAVEYAQRRKEDKQLGQSNLFEDSNEQDAPNFKFTEFPPVSRTERLNLEKQLIGFYFSGHPLDEYKEIWQDVVTVTLGQIETYKTGNCVLAGIIKNIKPITTSKGGRMAFASLEDYNGEIEVTFFSGPWERMQNIIKDDSVVILKGKIDYQKDKDRYGFLAESVINKHEVPSAVKEIKELEEKNKLHRNTWLYMADLKSASINNAKKGSYTIIGYLKSLREFKDRNDNDMAFGTLQDFEGDIDLVFFSRAYSECRTLLNLDEITAFKGNIDPENERDPQKISFKVSSIADFAQLTRAAARKKAAGEAPPAHVTEERKPAEKPQDEIHIKLAEGAADNEENLIPLRDYLAENTGACIIFLHVPVSGKEKVIRAFSGVDISGKNDVIEEIQKCKCVDKAWRK
jgi:DNA polymerase-3 subunit alpha